MPNSNCEKSHQSEGIWLDRVSLVKEWRKPGISLSNASDRGNEVPGLVTKEDMTPRIMVISQKTKV